MFFALAVLMLQPQTIRTWAVPTHTESRHSFSAEKIGLVEPTNISRSHKEYSPANHLAFTDMPTGDVDEIFPMSATATSAPASEDVIQPAAETADTLPDAPVPATEGDSVTPLAFIKPGKATMVSVEELKAENRRKQLLWKGLVIASSGAATFDAWTTRRAITQFDARELNPVLKPFAGNSSLYAAIQVGPALLDFAGKKMMYNRHAWVRRMWWVPQSASFVSSIFCGAHNLSYR